MTWASGRTSRYIFLKLVDFGLYEPAKTSQMMRTALVRAEAGLFALVLVPSFGCQSSPEIVTIFREGISRSGQGVRKSPCSRPRRMTVSMNERTVKEKRYEYAR